MAFPTGWLRKQKITIENPEVAGSGSHTDFPMLVTLDHLNAEIVNAGSNSALNGGGDIRFSSDSAGTTQLACEVIEFVTNATAGSRKCTIWVKIPSVSTSVDTDFYIWYKKTGETQPSASSTYGSENVWKSDYIASVHDNGSDSTGNTTFTKQGSPTQTTGPFGTTSGADDYGGHGDNYGWTATVSNYQTFTLQAWVQANGNLTDDIDLVAAITQAGFAGYVSLYQESSNWASYSSNDDVAISSSSTLNAWTKLDLTFEDGVGTELFVNGSSVATSAAMDDAATGKVNYYLGYTGFGVQNFDGLMAEHRLLDSIPASGWFETEQNNQNTPADFATAGTPESTLNAYSLIANVGSYTLTGRSATLTVSRKLVAVSGTYSLTGHDAVLSHGCVLVAGKGSYSLTGRSVNLLVSRKLSADTGGYTLSGKAATLTYSPLTGYTITADKGSYSLTGQSGDLRYDRRLIASNGSYALSGQEANLLANRKLTVDNNSYNLTGYGADLLTARTLSAASGSYTLIGRDATLTYNTGAADYTLSAENGSYTLTGYAGAFTLSRKLSAGHGTYTLTGYEADLITVMPVMVPEYRKMQVNLEERKSTVHLEDRTVRIVQENRNIRI